MKLDTSPAAIAVGFLAALGVFAGLLWFIGVREVVETLLRADPLVLAVVAAVAVGWLIAWALSLRTVLSVLGAPVGVASAVLVFAAATFANNVTPFGQAGGEPFSAWLISDATGREYETGFAAIASTDALHFVPSITLGLLGVAYYAVTATLGRQFTLVAAAVAGLAVVIPSAAYLGWNRRYALESRVVAALTPAVRTVGGALPRVDPPGETAIRRRIEGFFAAIERVATDRRGLALAVGFSALGWIALAASLWLSLYALGYTVPFAAALVAIPVGDLAAAMPFPGGLGGVEALLVGLLVALTPLAVETVGAAVLIYRAATYWLPTVAGGGAAALIAHS